MPINYKDYHPKWRLISRLVRFRRASNHCEQCGVENYRLIRRQGKDYRYATAAELSQLEDVRRRGWHQIKALKYLGLTKVILTVAHLDRNRANNRFANLRALCQGCHLRHDRAQHVRSRAYGRHHDQAHQLTVFASADALPYGG